MTFERVVFLLRNPLAGLPLAFGVVLALHGHERRLGLWLAGAAIFALGLGLRAWAGCLNNYGRGMPRRLATSGPYSAMRNPLYLGSALAIVGASLSAGSVGLALLAGPWAIAVYHVVVLGEEPHLKARYAVDYAEYVDTVPRWLPLRILDLRPVVPLGRFARRLLDESRALPLLIPFLVLQLRR